MLSISSKNMEVLPTQPRQPEMKRADNKDQKLFTNREMKQRTTEILKNSIKPKPQLESRTVLQQKHEEFRQEPVLTKKSQDYNITDMTKFSLPVGALQNNMRTQIKQKSTPIKDDQELGCTPPSSHQKKLMDAVNRRNSENKYKATNETISRDSAKVRLDFGGARSPAQMLVSGSQLEALRSPKGPI